MAPQSENRRRSVGVKLTVVSRQLWQDFDQSIDSIGVSRAKWRLIATVASRPGVTQRLIAELLEISEVTAGRLIDRLCADGYLERRENPNDRRAHCIHVTPAAQPVLERLGDVARKHEAETFAGLDDADLDKLEAILDMIARNIAARRGAGARRWAGGRTEDEPEVELTPAGK